MAAQAGEEAASEGAQEDDHLRAPPPPGDAAIGRRGRRRDPRRARERGDPRRHLRHLRLRQRLLPRRAPDRRRQVPGLRALVQRAADDPRPGHPRRRRSATSWSPSLDITQTIARDRDGLDRPRARRPLAAPLRAEPDSLRSTRPLADRGRHRPRQRAAPASIRRRRALGAARSQRRAWPAAAASRTSTRRRSGVEVRGQRQLRPGLPRDPHRPLPLRPLRERPGRALRHEARPRAQLSNGPATGRSASGSSPSWPRSATLRRSFMPPRDGPRAECRCRSGRTPKPKKKRAAAPGGSPALTPGYDLPPRGTGQTG